MADSEEFRIKRLMHEQEQSRVFDQVMGLGNFADSSQCSNSSSKSDGPQGTPAGGRVSGQEEQLEEDNSNSSGSRHEEKIVEAVEESLFPCIASAAKDQRSTFTMGPSGGGTGEAAFDNALDGLPSFGPDEDEEDEEEEDEDWNFAIPAESMQDGDYVKVKGKNSHSRKKLDKMQEQSSPLEPSVVEEQLQREATSGSANTSHSSKDNTPESCQDVGIVNQTRETVAQIESEHPPVVERNPVLSPNITIKDEPIDEGYNAALLPQSNPRQIKEELEHQEDELRISSVYSVGGGNALLSPTAHQMTVTPPQQTTIFIQGRGTVLQAVAPLSVRPPAPIHTSLAALTQLRPRPPVPPIAGSVRCSGCMKILLKGQTAFQRKGSTQLFCSTVCLTGHLPPRVEGKGNQLCSLCNCEILRARDTITIPTDDNMYFHFCGQHCLSIFRHRAKKIEKVPEKVVDKPPEKKIEKPQEKPAEKPEDSAMCSVCRTITRIEHEVSHHGRLHKLCSDACFVTWRKMRQLAMNCCEGCGLYCNSSSDSYHTLTFDKSELNFCGPTCIATYKQSCRRTVECAKCHKPAMVSVTIMERDEKGKVQLYCSPVCVQMSRPQQHTLSESSFPCCLCKTVAIPQFHLAMVDGTIRNFCSYKCVSTFRRTGHFVGADLLNGKSSPKDAPRLGPSSRASSVPPFPQDFPSSAPYSSHHGSSNSSVPPLVPPPIALTSTSAPGQDRPGTPAAQPMKMGEGGRGDPKVSCHQCTKLFFTKPLLFGHKDQIDLFCSMTCLDLYKTQNNILVMCEVCNKDKMPFDTMHYNGKDIFFCSKQCKKSFQISLASRNKDALCRPCSYCFSISEKMLHSHYGGKLEEFCKPLCMSQYTVLYYGMGRCDSCRKQGYLNEKLQYMGSVRNFCNLACLLSYCSLNFESRHHSNGTGAEPPHAPAQPQQSSKANPVIADVVSLANGSATQPNVPSDIALTGGLPNSSFDGKILDHASTQTDAMRGPPSYRRQMKNKSVLCRPFTVDQECSCLLLTPSTDRSDDSTLYGCEKAVEKMKADQETAPSPPLANCSKQGDKVKVVMVPVPVPVFIPVPMNMYSQHTPVPMALPITLPVPVVIPPQCKEVRDAATQWDPWNDGTEGQCNAEVSLDQGDLPLGPVPVITPPQRKDVAIQLDPMVLVTQVQNNTKAASQIKDVKDLAVQTDAMVAAQVPLPSSKDVVNIAVQTDSGLEKKDHLDDSTQLTPIVCPPICVPPLCKPTKAAADVQPGALDEETADPVQYGVWTVEPGRQMTCDDSSAGHSKSTSEIENPTIAEVEESPNNAQTKILRPLTLARKKETSHYSRKRKRKAKSTPKEHQDTVTAEQHSPSLQMSNCEDVIPLGLDESQTSVVVKPKITQIEDTSDAAQNKILPPITIARKKVASPSPCTRKLRTKPTSDPQDTSNGGQQSPSLPMGQDESTILKVVETPINQNKENPTVEEAKILPPNTLASKKMATRTSRKRKMKAQPTGDNKDAITAEEEPSFSPMINLEHEIPLGKDESATSELNTPTIPQVEESPNTSQTKIILPITLVKKKKGNRSSRKCKLKAKPTSDLKDTIAAPSLVTDLDNVLPFDQSQTKAPEVVMSTIQQVEENPNPAQSQIPLPVISTREKVATIQQVEENPNPAQTQILPSVILSMKKVPVRSTRKRKVKAEPKTSEEQDSMTVEQPVQSAQMTESVQEIPIASELVNPAIVQVKESQNTVQTKVPPPPTTAKESTRSTRQSQAQKSSSSEPSDSITPEQQAPSSPMADLENDFPMDQPDLKTLIPQRGVKRPREGFSGRKRGRRRTSPVDSTAALTPVNFDLKYMYGVKAWKCWVQLHNAHSKRSNPVVVKEEILQCDSAELSYALSHFVKEVRRPNGEAYSADSIFYLCLGIQQYLFTKGRIENIFNDELYSQFALEISAMLRLWKPKQLPNGSLMSSRVEESFLWECKQLGAYSPIVLLNTLLFFYTKNFQFTTVAQHQSLSFANFSLHTKPCSRTGKVIYLKYQQSIALPGRGETTERMKKKHEKAVTDMEMEENVINPLHCPVRLYEFYLSRCPPTAVKRTDMFYLQPERNVHTHSSYWYTSHTLHHTILQSMLTRILAVKEVQR
ncbi:zinc finger MYM-type protein 4-like isoform X2 [Stigmatopora nigra]